MVVQQLYPPLLTPNVFGAIKTSTPTLFTPVLLSSKLRLTFDRAVVDSEALYSASSYTVTAPAGATTPVVLTVTSNASNGALTALDLTLFGDLVQGGSYGISLATGLAVAADVNQPGANTDSAVPWLGAGTAPVGEVAYATADTRVRVLFSKAVRQVSAANADDALNPANYTVLDSALVPQAVTHVEVLSPRLVVLTVPPQVPGASYSWEAANIKDLAGNVLSLSAGSFTGFQAGVAPPVPPASAYEELIIGNINPSDGAQQVNPRPRIYVDVTDSLGFLDATSIRVTASGALVYFGTFREGWTGTVFIIENGVRLAMQPPSFLGDNCRIEVTVSASNIYGLPVKKTWSFTTYPQAAVARLELLQPETLRVHFQPGVVVSAELLDAANFVLIAQGSTRPSVVSAITSPSAAPGDVVSFVDCTLSPGSVKNGRYQLTVEGLTDVFGRTIESAASFVG